MAVDTSSVKQKARLAIERRNYAYAIDLYLQALELNPGDAEARRALRAVEHRNVKENGTSRFSAVLKGLGSLIKMRLTRDPEKIIDACESYLRNDPGDLKVLMRLGRALTVKGDLGSGAFTFEDVHRLDPTFVPGLRMLQAVYKQQNRIQEALQVNNEILRAVPSDREASQAVRDLSAAGMTARMAQGVTTARRGSVARKVVRSDEDLERSVLDAHELRTREEVERAIEFTKQDIEKRPEDARLHVKLGNYYVRLKRYDEAKSAYDKAHEVSPTQYTIIMKLQDLDIRKMQDVEDEFKQKLKANRRDGAARKGCAEQHKKIVQHKLEKYTEREKQFPTDLGIAFALAEVQFELKLWDESIARFQRTSKDPNRRAHSLYRLGVAFRKKEQHDLAVEQFTHGIDGTEIMSEMKKTLLYERGVTYEEMGKKKEYKDDMLTIYQQDITFKDVAKRIEALR